jgi:phosphate uptake regulator
MKRKIIKQGAGTMTVSLPTKWVKKNNLKQGSEVEIEEKDNNVVISSEKIDVSRTFEMNTSTKKIMTYRTMQNAYNLGYDEIKINFDDPRILEKIKKTANELIGFEIVHESNKSCTLKELTGIQQLEFDQIFRRLFRIINGMAEDGLAAVEQNDKAGIDNVVSRDLEVNKFSNLCIRYLNKMGHPFYTKTSTYVVICNNLEVIGDGYKELFVLLKNSKNSKQYTDIIKKVNILFSKCYEFSFELKDSKANEMADLYEKLKKELEDPKYKDTKITNALGKIINFTITLQGLQMPFSK